MVEHLSSVLSGLRVLFQGSSTAGPLASVPEENTVGFTAPYPPPEPEPEESTPVFKSSYLPGSTYRESIRSVAMSEWRNRWTLSSGSGQSGSNYSSNSGASSSYMSNYSARSSGAEDLCTSELTEIAERMVSDGYLPSVFQSFVDSSSTPLLCYGGRSLENWFVELDVDWVLQPPKSFASRRQLQEMAERWIRALTVIVVGIRELVASIHQKLSVAQFGKASITPMLIFVDAVIHVCKAEKEHARLNGFPSLEVVLQMYICVSNASYDISMMRLISSEAQTNFKEISSLLDREGSKLIRVISEMMFHVRWRLHHDSSWAIDILRGGGEIHRKIRSLMNFMVSIKTAQASTHNSAPSNNSRMLRHLIDETVNYVKNVLKKKSELCTDPSLRYMFLLNNSYFIAQVFEPSVSHQHRLKLTLECELYMDSYLDVSWGHVLSCIPKSNFPGLIGHWINTSSLAKFESAFHEKYQTQKFWKVPDPRLRDALRRAIIERVISGYRDYLKEHIELAEQVSCRSSSPEVLEEMLGELFEG